MEQLFIWRGRTLEYASVVRELKQIGTIERKESGNAFNAALLTNSEWKPGNIRYVVFIYENSTLKILAVNQVSK